jgi:PAB1-binding protein PBP1
MKTIVLDLPQFVFLLVMISVTAWVWMKSLATCPKTFSDEYMALHHKYNTLVQERDKLKGALVFMQSNMVQQQVPDRRQPGAMPTAMPTAMQAAMQYQDQQIFM